MFNIGIGEILWLVFLVFIFVKPQNLPGFFRQLGHWVSKARLLVQEGRDFMHSLKEIEQQEFFNSSKISDSGDSTSPGKENSATTKLDNTPSKIHDFEQELKD